MIELSSFLSSPLQMFALFLSAMLLGMAKTGVQGIAMISIPMLAITPTNVPINKDVTTTGVAGFLYSNPMCLEKRDSFCTSKKMPIKTTDIIKYIREIFL